MKKRISRLLSRSLFLCLAAVFLLSCFPVVSHAESSTHNPITVVSLGDSYSSGEGITPFYGQGKPLGEKVYDADWIAHRSTLSWPSLLQIPKQDGTKSQTMSHYRADGFQENLADSSSEFNWYFVAASGATTDDMKLGQSKEIDHWGYKYGLCLDPQLQVFNRVNGTVDYVTLTIGGNDVDFAEIITICAMHSSYLQRFSDGTSELERKIADLWDHFDYTKAHIKSAYKNIEAAAGKQAAIIVAGYPGLLDPAGKGMLINSDEAQFVDDNVLRFNREIEALVQSCHDNEGMNIHFVDVLEKFKHHEAYAYDNWINPIMVPSRSEDIKLDVKSSYSMHPNERGAQAYAECVNEAIEQIAKERYIGTLSGKICSASDRSYPIQDAKIKVYQGDTYFSSAKSDSSGNYSIRLPAGDYRVEITASGYLTFIAYANVSANYNTYMETFLLVEGTEGEIGTASGTVTNAVSGSGLSGVSLTVRSGWNNTSHGDVITTATTDSSGKYSLSLPLGNYTVLTSLNGFVSSSFNIIVKEGSTPNQNGTMSPIVSGDTYRIVLTWGENPSDLDSHVVGILSSGDPFHVYYGHKSEYDNGIEVCNLDVDDTTSYGPETITLNTVTESPYYYYIYRYAGSGTVGSSDASIKVYKGEELKYVFFVPTDQGDGDYWNVFAVVNGKLVIRNTISSSADVSYAGVTNPQSLIGLELDQAALPPKNGYESSGIIEAADDEGTIAPVNDGIG